MPKILLIDDEVTHNYLNSKLLYAIGFSDVEAKTSGKDGLQYLEECSKKNKFPDIIFLDLNMAGMNGFKFMEHYYERFGNLGYGSRIIVLTNSILDIDREEALKHESVLYFWNKPLTKYKVLDLFKDKS